MAILTITAANVAALTGSSVETGAAAVAVTAGQWVYLDTLVTGKYAFADDDSATAIARKARGVALNSAAVGQPLAVATGGPVNVGATLTPGVAYYLSRTPGAICPVGDLIAGDFPCLVGLAANATVLNIDIQSPGVSL